MVDHDLFSRSQGLKWLFLVFFAFIFTCMCIVWVFFKLKKNNVLDNNIIMKIVVYFAIDLHCNFSGYRGQTLNLTLGFSQFSPWLLFRFC